MTKAIFFDIDGTLVPLKTKVYGASVKQALEKLRSRGILLFVATGRSKFEIASEHLLDGLQFDDYLTNNGQDAYDAAGNLIYGKPIDPRDAESLLNWAEKKGCTFWMVSAEKTCINHPSEPFLQAMHALHTAPPPAGDLREMLRRPVYKIVLFLPREEMAEPLRLAPHSRATQWFEQGHDIISLDGGKENAMYAAFKPWKEKKIFACNTFKLPYFDEEPFRPDFMLRDLVMILHPELGISQPPRYFSPIK